MSDEVLYIRAGQKSHGTIPTSLQNCRKNLWNKQEHQKLLNKTVIERTLCHGEALQVVTGLQPFHLQIQQEATPELPELLDQDLHPSFSTLDSVQQITKAKAVEFIFTLNIFYSTTKCLLQKIKETQEPRLYGSKTEEGADIAYCILENYGIIASWQGKLNTRIRFFKLKSLHLSSFIPSKTNQNLDRQFVQFDGHT
ncbi:hypothetical protein AVEN_172818-1 [Araneus ventricosus]|uniref:Uncharacterized protein n=1 Tax=Araneus ventricosus TaxID=182803 RepID=A0A4Y2BKZ3_ARAVE|nr:hypothetical protein AVEN_172818-1 [Araneus ventricosus]